jgi:hypothetical protein
MATEAEMDAVFKRIADRHGLVPETVAIRLPGFDNMYSDSDDSDDDEEEEEPTKPADGLGTDLPWLVREGVVVSGRQAFFNYAPGKQRFHVTLTEHGFTYKGQLMGATPRELFQNMARDGHVTARWARDAGVNHGWHNLFVDDGTTPRSLYQRREAFDSRMLRRAPSLYIGGMSIAAATPTVITVSIDKEALLADVTARLVSLNLIKPGETTVTLSFEDRARPTKL